jgi:uncharacterized membrane protein
MSVLDCPERVRRVIGALTVLGGVALAVFTVLERPLVGVGVYALSVVGAVTLQLRTTVPVFDERDEAISRDAAQWTLTILGLGSAGVFPALTVAWGLDHFEWQAWSSAIALFVAALFVIYGAFLAAFHYRR